MKMLQSYCHKYGKTCIITITLPILIGLVVGLLTTLEPNRALILVGILALVLVAYCWPSWPFFLIPWAIVIWIPLMNFGGSISYTITVLDALVALLGIEIMLAFLGLWPRIRGRDQHFPVQILVLAWLPLLPATIGGLITFGPGVLTRGFLIFTKRWAEYSLFPLAACLFLPKKSVRWVTYSLIGATIVLGVSAFIPEFGEALLSYVGASTGMYGEFGSRATGLLFNPNVYGNFSILIINFLISLLLIHPPKNTIGRWFLIFLLLVPLGTFALSGSREALLGFAISLVFWSGWAIRRRTPAAFYRWTRVVVYFVGVVVILTAFLPHGGIMLTRVKEFLAEGTSTYNVAARIEAQSIGSIMFFDHPLGIGVGNIGLLGNEYLREYGVGYLQRLNGTDSQYIGPLIEGGVFGLLFLLLTLWLLYRRNRETNEAFAVSTRVNILSLAIAGFAAYTFYAPSLAAMIWLLAGLSEATRK